MMTSLKKETLKDATCLSLQTEISEMRLSEMRLSSETRKDLKWDHLKYQTEISTCSSLQTSAQ